MAMLTTAEAAKVLRRSISTLRKWRVMGRGPRYYEPEPSAIYYDAEDLDAFMHRNPKRSTSDADQATNEPAEARS